MKKKLANWGNYPVKECNDFRFCFDDEIERDYPRFVNMIARGNGRCYGDASLADTTITTVKYDKILSFDVETGVLEMQSGVLLDKILELTVPKGWFLPVTPGTKFITIGGGVASDVHGKNHHVDGSISNHVLEMDVLVASNQLITCSPAKNAQLFEATCGGMGLTGLITRVVLKLKKIESSFIVQKQIKAHNLDELIVLFEKYKHYTYSVAWIDCLQRGESFGRSILMLGEHAKVEDLPSNKRADPLSMPGTKQMRFPFFLPSWVLNQFTVKAFNALFYAKNLKREIDTVVSYEPFFYPLDAILDWNRGYGRRGFVQYQFVLPLTSKDGLVKILKRISEKGMGSFLAVLKVFGKQESMISFPTEGYTLALDFPVTEGLFEFLDELDQLVLEFGGRLYMSKDARMKPGILVAGYPRLPEFKQIIKAYDPDSRLHSLLSDRLGITENPTV